MKYGKLICLISLNILFLGLKAYASSPNEVLDSCSQITKIQADSLRKQALVDSLMSRDLGEVTVEAQNRHTNALATTYLPTSKQKNIAQTASDLLRVMGITQIKVNPQDNSVTDNFGNNVALFINYLPLTPEDQQGLSTADVRKVEYLEFPTDPRFRGAEKVLNFIVQEYEYGGYTKVYTGQNGTHVYYGNYGVFSKFSYKKITFDFFADVKDIHDNHFGFSENRVYSLLDKSGKIYDLNRNQTFDKGHIIQRQIPATLRVTYSSDKVQIRNTIGYSFRSTPEFYYQGQLLTAADPETVNTISRSTPERSNNLSYTGDFYFALPGNFTLDFTPEFYYSHNHGYYDYLVSQEPPVSRENLEDAYTYRANLSISKKFNKKHTTSIYINQNGNINNITYNMLQYVSPQKFRTSQTTVSLDYKFNSDRLSIDARAGLGYDITKNNDTKITDFYPTFNLSTQYAFSNQSSTSLRLNYATLAPNTGYKTTEILQSYDVLYQTGNPNLENARRLTAELSYNWMPSNKFSASVYGSFSGYFDRVLQCYEHYIDGSAVLRSYMNNGNFYLSKIGASFNLNLLENKLNVYAAPSIVFNKSTGLYDRSYNPFQLYISSTYYLNQFYFQASYQPPYKYMSRENAAINQGRHQYGIIAGWGNSNWNIRISSFNFFNKGFVSETSDMVTPLVKSLFTSYDSFTSPMFTLTAIYTIGYGKKIRRGNEVGEQGSASSSILK